MRTPVVLTLAAALSACGIESEGPTSTASGAIIGGVASPTDNYPSAGMIIMMLGLFGSDPEPVSGCSATLIAPDVVLTAAHCVGFGGLPIMPEFVFTNRASGAEAFVSPRAPFPLAEGAVRSRSFVGHPGFSLFGLEAGGLGEEDDIGLVFLDRPILDIEPARLPDSVGRPSVSEGTEVSIVGYGLRTPNGAGGGGGPGGPGGGLDLSDALKFEAVTRITEVGPYELRVGRTSTSASPLAQKCNGDSGGPSYVRAEDGALYVVGVTSRAYDATQCETGGVDTRVDAYLDWIREEMGKACDDGRRPGAPGEACLGSREPDAGLGDLGVSDSGAADSGSSDAGPGRDSGSMVPDVGAGSAAPPPAGLREAEGCRGSGAGGPALAPVIVLGLFWSFQRLRRRRR